jgi:hypothetical protein
MLRDPPTFRSRVCPAGRGAGTRLIANYPSEDRRRVNDFSKTINTKQDKI